MGAAAGAGAGPDMGKPIAHWCGSAFRMHPD